jgi:hypothetical protein
MNQAITRKETFGQAMETKGIQFGPDSPQALSGMREAKGFLDPYRRWIRSLLLFGSYALERAERDSDIDWTVFPLRCRLEA